MIRWIATAMFIGCASAAVAQDVAQDEAPMTEAACLEASGRWERAGLAWQPQCILPTPDAGEACETAADCTGYCLADTRTCSAETPLFGCIPMLDLDGAAVTLCID